MESMRLSHLWKKVFAAIDKAADGRRTGPSRPWFEQEAPEGEEPESAMSEAMDSALDKLRLGKDTPDAEGTDAGEEKDVAEQFSESTVHVGPDKPSAPGGREIDIPKTRIPGSVSGPATAYDPDYIFEKMDEQRRDTEPGSVEDSLLLDPSEKERVLSLFNRWDPAFLAQKHQETGVPGKKMTAPTKDGGTEDVILSEREKVDSVKEQHAALKAEYAQALMDFRAEKDPTKKRAIKSKVDKALMKMERFNKSYGPGGKKSPEALRHEDLKDLSEGENRYEKSWTAPYEFDKEWDRPQADIDAENAALDKAEKEFAQAKGLAGQLLSKKDNSLSPEERGNLGVVLQGLFSLLSKNELSGTLDRERRLVREMMVTLRKLTDKYSQAIGEKSVKEIEQYVEEKLSGAERNRQERRTSLELQHGNDPVRIAIIASIQRSAGGGMRHTLRDKMVGKTPIRSRPSRTDPYAWADLTTQVSTHNPQSAFDEMILKGPARAEFDETIKRALGIHLGEDDGDADKVIATAGSMAADKHWEEYAKLMGRDEDRYPGTLSPKHESEDGATKPEKPAATSADDVRDEFVADYVKLANSVLDEIIKRTVVSEPDDTQVAEDPYFLARDPEPELKDPYAPIPPERRDLPPSPDYKYDEAAGKYYLSEEREEGGKTQLSEEERSKKSKDVAESREKASAPLTRDILFRPDGTMKDVKELLVELPDERHDDLGGILEAEMARMESKGELTEDEGDLLDQLRDSIEQFHRVERGRSSTSRGVEPEPLMRSELPGKLSDESWKLNLYKAVEQPEDADIAELIAALPAESMAPFAEKFLGLAKERAERDAKITQEARAKKIEELKAKNEWPPKDRVSSDIASLSQLEQISNEIFRLLRAYPSGDMTHLFESGDEMLQQELGHIEKIQKLLNDRMMVVEHMKELGGMAEIAKALGRGMASESQGG